MNATERLTEINTRIVRAAKLAGRAEGSVTLIAVSKTHGPDQVRPLLEAGHRDFGENRVQEAAGKWPELKAEFPDVRLHLIGQLQSNKAADAAALFDTIHSLDRPSLLSALARLPMAPPVFVQVNIGDEPQKGGCALLDLPAFLTATREANLDLRGLMAVPPEGIEPAPFFALLGKLARDHGLGGLSMGMSSDFETAIMLGATHIRVGSALFGERAAA